MMYHIMKHQNSEYKYLFLILAYNLTADTYIGTLVSECLAIKNVLRMQGGHKPFSYVAISFSPKHYLMCSRFCLVWTLLLCIWRTVGFAWLYVCVSLNLVTCVFYLIAFIPVTMASRS